MESVTDPPVLLLILFTSSGGLLHRLSRLHWTGFIIINLGLSCLITHTWFLFPLISMLYLCPLSLSVIVPISVGHVSTYALVQLYIIYCVLRVLSHVVQRGLPSIFFLGTAQCFCICVCFGYIKNCCCVFLHLSPNPLYQSDRVVLLNVFVRDFLLFFRSGEARRIGRPICGVVSVHGSFNKKYYTWTTEYKNQ